MRSTPDVENRPQSYPEKNGLFASRPFHRTRVCVELEPRVNKVVSFPEEPPRMTIRPGTVRSASATSRTARSRSEEHTSELQSRLHLVCRLLLEKKKKKKKHNP